LNNIIRKTKELERIYRERNKLLVDSGLEDFAFSTKEIEKHIAEAIGKEMKKQINTAIKEGGL
tara:strand:+ start:3383 stop:3571 length:189 start_codon:yes stop_codon:yes gene_type:complete